MQKMTKREMFNAIKAIAEVSANEDMVAFIDHEIELLDKKSANKKATSNQVQNEEFKEVILEVLNGAEPMTVTEIMAKDARLSALSNQRVSAILRLMKEVDKTVVKTVDKKKSLFSLA